MKKLCMIFCVLAMLGALPASAAPARAAPRSTGGGLDGQVTVLGILGYSYYWANAYGVGVRYQKVLAPNVLKAKIRDDIALEGGLDLMYSTWDFPSYDFGGVWYTTSARYIGVSPVVGIVWNFWLNDKLSLYPKLDLGWEFGSLKYESTDPLWNTYYNTYYSYYHSHAYGGAYLDLAGGLAYKTDGGITLRGQVGIHGLYFGVGFQL